MPIITNICGREILDSRGEPALEVELTWDHKFSAKASVPSGASTGSFEALELRDKDPKRYFGRGLLKSLAHLENIFDRLKGYPIDNLSTLDNLLKELDGTENKSRLGANTILSLSLAGAKAMAKLHQKELFEYLGQGPAVLPVPLINVLNGGAHADNNLCVQEFMIVPYGFNSFRRAIQAGSEIFHTLKLILKEQKYRTTIGDEGGFAPQLPDHESALKLLLKAIKQSGYSSDSQVALAIDVAAEEFCQKKSLDSSNSSLEYVWENERYTARDLVNLYKDWISRYPLISIEDGLGEEDWEGWTLLTKELGHKIQLVGDDLFVTHLQRLKKGIQKKVANCLLVKINQVGTLSEAQESVHWAHKHGYACCASHRSGETEDTSLADLSLAWSAEQVKTGSVCRGERTAKYNRFLRIEEKFSRTSFAGAKAFQHLT